jgi:hypothetical protein
MSLPDVEASADLSLAELRALVGTLLTEVARLRAENQALRDEIARLKGLPPRPTLKPSGMEKATQPAAGKPRSKRGRRAKRLPLTDEQIVTVAVPAGSRFKGYETLIVQDLELSARAIRYRRERWRTPTGATVIAPVPAGVVGGFGPGLRRFVLAAHIQGQVTSERLVALLRGIGVEISKRQVVRLLSQNLETFQAEDRDVLRAGLSTARWITVDDTAARHANQDGTTTQIGNDRFTVFRTGFSKSREAFLAILRAGHGEYIINDEGLAYMRGRNLAGPVIDTLLAHPQRIFADAAAWRAHLEALGFDRLAVTPDPVTIATEGALWGAIRHHGLLDGTVVVSDDAGQFRVGEHALCWVHAERLVHKLVPATPAQRRAVALMRHLIWWFYADLKAYCRDPCRRRAAALRARFDRIFRRRTGYVLLDRLLARLYRRKRELLRVLERPEIPLHTNGSENDIRACVTKRKISGGTMSEAGRTARDVLLGLMKTCHKLKLSFWHYLGDRLSSPGAPTIPSLPELIRHAAPA